VQHPHPKDTCYGSWAWGHDKGIVTKTLSAYPNAIAFSGHSHYSLTDDRSIWQGSFTSVGAGSLRYTGETAEEWQTGFENGRGGDWRASACKLMRKARTKDCRQGMLWSVYDDCIVVRRREFLSDLDLGPDWVMPLPTAESRPFAFAEHAKKMRTPEFPAGTKPVVRAVTVINRGGSSKDGKDKIAAVKKSGYEVSVPPVVADGNARLYTLEFSVKAKDGKICTKYIVPNGFNHSIKHSPDEMFRQVLMTRIVIEDAAEHSVLSYASPFGWYGKSWLSQKLRTLAAKMIMETGHWVSGDNPFDGVPRNEWYPANRFAANDRNPNYEAFKKGLAQQTKLAKADEMSPRVTLGTHSWCDDAGNALQEVWIKRHCLRPDWVQLNDYEYGAYRYSFLNGNVSRKSHSGKRAVFMVRRFDPAALGDEISLSLRFSSQPVSVKCGDRELVKDGNGCWTLPHDAFRACVSKVGGASEDGVCAELPEIAMTVEPDRKSSCVVVKITNRSKNDFRDLYGVVHLPPEFAVRRRAFEIKSLAAGSTIKRSVAFGDAEAEVCPVDRQLFAASMDYTMHGTRKRLWAKTEADSPQSISVVRDTAMWTDAVYGKDLDEAELKALSAERGALRNLSGGITWKRPDRTPADAWYNATVGGNAYSDTKLKEVLASGKAAVAVAYQFEAKGDTVAIFANRSSAGKNAAVFFLNGEKVDVHASPAVLPTKKGVNRIVIKVSAGDWRLSRNIQLAVCNSCRLGDPCAGVPFVK